MERAIRFRSASSKATERSFFNASDGADGYELWRTDGTANGTVMVKDIDPANGNPAWLTDVNGILFFSAGNAAGNELWKSNGTAASTVMVKDIFPGQDRVPTTSPT